MDAVALVEQARMAGLRVSTAGDRLIVRGPKTAERIAQTVLDWKAAVVAVLRQEQPHLPVGRATAPRQGELWTPPPRQLPPAPFPGFEARTAKFNELMDNWRAKRWGPCQMCGQTDWYQDQYDFSHCGHCDPPTQQEEVQEDA
jgi:hypothetical protein